MAIITTVSGEKIDTVENAENIITGTKAIDFYEVTEIYYSEMKPKNRIIYINRLNIESIR